MTRKEEKNSWYWEVVVHCSPVQTEILSGYMFENAASGIEELNDSGETIRCKVFFNSNDYPQKSNLQVLVAKLQMQADSVTIETIEQKEFENWQSNWKEHFKPIFIGDSFVIRPPWETPCPDKKEIVIEPGLGFGTGYHESTNLALQLLDSVPESNLRETVIDVGTGSGILSIAALLTGARNVLAFDIDGDAVKEVRKNIELSGLDSRYCDVRVSEISQITQPANLVLANIEDHILISISSDLIRLVASGGMLLLSGILKERRDKTLKHFTPRMTVVKEMEMAEWYAVSLQKQT